MSFLVSLTLVWLATYLTFQAPVDKKSTPAADTMGKRSKSKNQGRHDLLSLPETELSEDAIQRLRSELPKALAGSIDDAKKLIQSRAALRMRIDYATPAFDGYSSTDIPLLHVASAYGSPEIVDFLLDAGADIEETTDAGSTLLHLAARNGCDENLRILFKRGAKPLIDAPMNDRNTPLIEGVWGGNIGTCQLLIAQGADVGLNGSQGRTALMFAASEDRAEIIDLLLEAGADVDQVCDAQWTALNYAVKLNRHKSTKLLLNRGADRTVQEGDIGNALHLAAMYGRPDVITELLSGAQDGYVDSQNSYGNTALHLTAIHGQPHVTQILIDHGADKNIVNNELSTPLHIACSTARPDVAKVLIQNDAHVDMYNETDNTPLQLAASSGEAEVVSILLGRGAKVDTNNKNGNTALQLASARGHHEVVRILLSHNAAIGTRTMGMGSTSLHLASDNGHTKVIPLLLAHKADLTQVDTDGCTALHLACDKGHADAARLLLDNGADIDARSYKGLAPLYFAATDGDIETVKLLLDRGAAVNCVNAAGNTPLHAAFFQGHTAVMDFLISQGAEIHQKNIIKQSPFDLACVKPSIGPFTPILMDHSGLLRTNSEGWSALHYACSGGRQLFVQELLGSENCDPSLRTLGGQSPLQLAIKNDHVDVVLSLLSSRQYYPDKPILCHACRTARDEIPVIAEGLKEILRKMNCDQTDEAKCILYWAIANSQAALIDDYFPQWFGNAPRLKGGMTCLHVAALYGHTQLIKHQFANMDIFDITDDGLTSFHIATASGHQDVMQALLERIQADPVQEIEAIIMLTKYRESALSLAVKGRDSDVKDLLWLRLEDLALKNCDFYSNYTGQAEQLLELAAQLEKPGKETYLQMMFNNWFGKSRLGHSGATVLHRAIEHKQAVVLWWLLANGAHFKKDEIDLAHQMLHKKTDDFSLVMIDLIQNPPQIVEQAAITDSDRPPVRPKMPGSLSALKELPVTIIDFYGKEDSIDLHYTERSIKKIIYDSSSGPNEIMQSARRKSHRQLKSLRQDLTRIKDKSLKQEILEEVPHQRESNDIDHTDMESWTDLGNLQFRWLHVPANHQEFAACTESSDPKDGPSNLPPRNRLALYMPFLTLGKLATEDHKSARSGSQEPMTLDQYFYPTIADTNERDKSQVVSRYLERERVKNHAAQGIADSRNVNAQGPIAPSMDVDRTILIVDQVWMWILDGSTIITSSSKPPNQREDILSAGIRDFVMSNQSKSSLERVKSMDTMIEVVLGLATGLFMKRIISTEKRLAEDKPDMKSALEVFRESIRSVVNAETNLFRDFMNSLENEKKNPPERYHKGWIDDMPENPYHIISEEARLLDEIKDIHDELNMLRTLAESQQLVWQQAFQSKDLDSFTHFQFHDTCTPNMILRDIQDMITEAEMVQESINTLLDLRQKQASIKEAEFGRRQANDTAKQANIVLVFTLVTILFLPLSFLSSVFALNVTDFPHGSESVEYQARWIFPILCMYKDLCKASSRRDLGTLEANTQPQLVSQLVSPSLS
ncbi:unnamed protein product [Penicillium salamii]|uniref:Mg2+ transporter protein, CorA-like/Zinc transport protein ZntB n=1 Tax=Penicillium salamii TaxID=1612424 RepID=A0A9W4I7A7_9EURO|nr:unnamed protein product [Penicillium salamii]